MSSIEIIATIGPSCKEKETLALMVEAGMSIARLNFSWGTHEEHGEFVRLVREIATERGIVIPIIQDLSGPRVQETEGHTFDPSSPVVTQKDLEDLVFAEKYNPEYIALSFVRNTDDVKALRREQSERGITSRVIAKIERKEALDNLDAIIAEADGIMIARGDLGEAMPFESIPFIKKDILKKCAEAKKPVIVATEMLTSMIGDPDPSRADVSDIAQAVLDGTSATMLSNETAVGEFPIQAVRVMRKVVDEALENSEFTSPVRFIQ
jgi:pyruvate kinase